MNTILHKIIAVKKKEIEQAKRAMPADHFASKDLYRDRPAHSLKKSLSERGSSGIIAEFKRKSPSKGWFKTPELKVEQVVTSYDKFAAGISILTDQEFFGGTLNDLSDAGNISMAPLLRKDFIIDPWQIAESKAAGADVILLIAACLSPKEVMEYATYADSLEMESILEIHDEKELGHLCDAVTMIGINNRNLENFTVDMETSFRLIRRLPAGKPVIAESGISDVHTIVTLRKAGFNGFLIGEYFMKQDDPGLAFEEFIHQLKGNNL